MSNGILNNEELIDTLVADLNNLVKDMASGQYVHFCIVVSNMTQKLVNLKTGIKSDIDNKNEVIESLKQTIRNMGEDVKDVSIEEYIEKYQPKLEEKDGAE